MARVLLDAGQFALPFYAAAVLQAVYLVAYQRVFRSYEPPRGGQAEPAEIAVESAEAIGERGDPVPK